MFEKILVPLDGSALAECALPHAITMAHAFDSAVFLVRVLERPGSTADHPINLLDWELQKNEAAAYLRRTGQALLDQNVACHEVLMEGDAAERLVDYLEEEDIDLVVLSSHGRSGANRWNTGSVMHKIVQSARRSVLIVRADPAGSGRVPEAARYRRLFVPLDGSPRAECAFNSALPLARHMQADLIVGSVIARPELPFQMELTAADRAASNHVADRSQAIVSKYLESLRQRHPEQVKTTIRSNDNIAAALHDMAEAEKADLMILCAHGFSGEKNWPYGSVTMMFIEYGHTPLLVIQDMHREPTDVPGDEAGQRFAKGR